MTGIPIPPKKTEAVSNQSTVKFGKIKNSLGHRIILYGPGGIGKTTLAAHAPGKVAFFDVDDSLSRLHPDGDIVPVDGIEAWQDIRDSLKSPGWDGIKTIVIDSATKAEELAVAHTIQTVKHEKGGTVKSIEDYGYGKGYSHVFETFLPLLADLDRHCRQGRHVILLCHDCATTCPNPQGEDWLRYEPRLQSPNSGKASIRLRVREWADHVLFYGYDIAVKDGKGHGSGTRTIYPTELPHCMAKSRTCSSPVYIDAPGPEIWNLILKEK